MFSLLPTSLLALLYASPAFAAPTTSNDAFRALALVAPKAPEEPICCLRPLPPLEPPADEDVLLSFEDWKAKRLSEHDIPHQVHKPPENLSESSYATPPGPSDPSQQTQTQQPVQADLKEPGGGIPPPERLAPQMRIPITDRFNYASLDCSARVHAAHKSAKSASAVLSSKKDRYMLSPCAEERQFVIVELCEDIRIDTVQLANYEFFSGVFKDFSVSVAKQYTTDPKEWVHAGTYHARNVRGVQSFHPPPTLRDFYRIIRIDFHSHYGSEYYCPLSLLRVYGLTQLEEWQWETWEAESRAKRSVEEASSPIEVTAEPPKPAPTPPFETLPTGNASVSPSPITNGGNDSSTAGTPTVTTGSIPTAVDIPNSHQSTFTSSSTIDSASHPPPDPLPPKTETEEDPYDSSRHRSDPVYHTPVSLSPSSPASHVHSTASDNHSSSIFIDLTQSDSSSSSSSYSASPSSRGSAAAPDPSSLSTLFPSYLPPSPPVPTGGESIYRTIMNRLTALEANTTLYARYVEEQTTGMREVLRRLTEDLGRLEGIGKAQAQLYHRSVVELEKQTQRLEAEQRLLLHRVNYLTDEVILEKRLGIAQLCLLLIVLVFLALTRGSRGEYVPPPGTRTSVREWGRRTLSFSGELVNRFRARSSTPPRTVSNQKSGENDIAFPTLDLRALDSPSRTRRSHHPVAGSSRRPGARPHTPTVRTPVSRHFAHSHSHHRSGSAHTLSPASLHVLRPGIQRSNSGGFGSIGPVPRSAKRWARSAHLHEVKNPASPRQQDKDLDADVDEDRETTPMPRASTSTADEGADAQVLLVPPGLERSDTIGKGSGKGKGRMFAAMPMVRQPSPLRDVDAIDLASPPLRAMSLAGSTGEASEWVDTDVSGSECDSVVGDAGLRERTFVRPTNSSL